MGDHPIHKCACGADCEWCVVANRARAAFPRAKSPPKHDGDTEHHCADCFLRLPGLIVTECNHIDDGEGRGDE